MSDQNQSLRDDLAFLRSMAEAGRDRPMAGGAILVASGAIFGAASLAVWAGVAIFALPPRAYSVIWLTSAVLFGVTLTILLRRMPKVGEGGQATAGMAWSYLGWSIFVMGASVSVAGWRLGIPNLMLVFPCVLMALYGAGWLIAAFISRQGWLRLVGYASFVASVVNAWFVDGPTVWLVYGLSLLGLLALPGLVMMRQHRRAG